ncbi:hypothetical protein EXN66_Car002393 [Channa argus]|uniref:Uncharacterized protein n=1 Tax=Channa argus TaxID=215402 RepID=A0A6G1P8V2_CHAAH|nr:hypothetical protein EXN66_Car002393 [Channa argus]
MCAEGLKGIHSCRPPGQKKMQSAAAAATAVVVVVGDWAALGLGVEFNLLNCMPKKDK